MPKAQSYIGSSILLFAAFLVLSGEAPLDQCEYPLRLDAPAKIGFATVESGPIEIGQGFQKFPILLPEPFSITPELITKDQLKSVLGELPSGVTEIPGSVGKVAWSEMNLFIDKLNQLALADDPLIYQVVPDHQTGNQYRLASRYEWDIFQSRLDANKTPSDDAVWDWGQSDRTGRFAFRLVRSTPPPGKSVAVTEKLTFETSDGISISDPVNAEQWRAVMGNRGSPRDPALDKKPLSVSQEDARVFIKKLNRLSKKGDPFVGTFLAGHQNGDTYRLPAEYEKAGKVLTKWYRGPNRMLRLVRVPRVKN